MHPLRCRSVLAVWLMLWVTAAMPAAGQNSPIDSLSLPAAFPADRYTPHGYIDNPFHSMIFNRSGVIRSTPPLGFGWWRAAFKGSYGGGAGDHMNYLSLLSMAVATDGTTFLTTEDFTAAGTELRSAYHTKHAMSYDWTIGATDVRILYFLPREHTLSCLAEFVNRGKETVDLVLYATHLYRIGDTKWWGSDGLAARYDSSLDASVSKIWAYGDIFVLGANAESQGHGAFDKEEQWTSWVRAGTRASTGPASVIGRGPLRVTQSYHLSVPPGGRREILVGLSRGKNEQGAVSELRAGLGEALPRLREQLQQDQAFWSACPVLEGSWPESWKRGWVYDYETLRMNVRQPIGIFNHPWDAMQVHTPRAVLGETSLDMMTLSYADPALAQEVIYGTFADAPMPNVPCVREDGSMNMISSDGSECGTAPMWGYPFHMIKSIFLATGDTAWVSRLYPHLASYITWWLEHRTDSEGWLHCNNSWESGQDGSRRFLVAEGNEGAVADFVRTVDVEASMAEAMSVMECFAGVVGKPDDAPSWKKLAERRVNNTRSMFVDGWFRDVDGRSNTPIVLKDHFDVMMLSPLTCDVATKEQVEALRPMFTYFREQQGRRLEWPPAIFTFCEAAWTARTGSIAANVLASTAERVYQRTDARTVRFPEPGDPFAYRVPGVANEFWPAKDRLPGGENYGWGATLPLNIIRTIVGFREAEDQGASPAFYLAPTLPDAFLREGRTYTIRNLHYRGVTFDVRCTCTGNDRLAVTLEYRAAQPTRILVADEAGGPPAESGGSSATGRARVTGPNGRVYQVSIHHD